MLYAPSGSKPHPASERPHILFVVNACWAFVSHRLPLARAAQRQGFTVHVAASSDETAAQLEKAGIHFHPLPISRKSRQPLRELRTFFALLLLYRRLRPDLVHHVTIKPILYGGLAARIARIPAVINAVAGLGYTFLARGQAASLFRDLVRFGYRRALSHSNQTVIFQNDDDRHEFVSRGLVHPRETALIRGSGVDPDEFTPAEAPAGRPLVVLPARLLWDKGVAEFVAAAAILKARGVEAQFALVGDPDPHNPASVTEADLAAWRASGAVEVWGRSEDMPEVFHRAHIACLPSYREGLPRALLEAAASGLPIVTTDVPGCREVVRDGHNGYLVPPRQAPALADALEKLIRDPVQRALMGRRGRALVLEQFTLDRVVSETLKLYRAQMEKAERARIQIGATTRIFPEPSSR
ncbi:MAG: glycosyltransferase family 4 protein [Longimicrobiaceae bacterium]